MLFNAHDIKLLYRGSRDKFTAKIFHQKVDGKGAHITIIQSKDNIFGGYTDISMSSPQFSESRDGNGNSFLFKLNQDNTFTVLKCKDKQSEIYHSPDYMSLFGDGDL